MPFFIRKTQKNMKRKLGVRKADVKSKKADEKAEALEKIDEDISSDSDDDSRIRGPKHQAKQVQDDSDDQEETAQEKKIRKAKEYLKAIEQEERERLNVNELDSDAINKRLRDDVLEEEGRLCKKVADKYTDYDGDNMLVMKNGHKLSVTCLAVAHHSPHVYSGSKDCCLVKWCLNSGRKIKKLPRASEGAAGHSKTINALALSSDDKFLASGTDGNEIHIWNPENLELLKIFRGHRGSISGLAFRKGSSTMFSCSKDRSVKVWNLEQMSYIETLFGHHERITSIDSLTRDRAISSGGRDTSIRIWKIIEESQLVFSGHQGSIDQVKLLDEQHFISVGDDGMICLWGVMKKKPMSSYANAHGTAGDSECANWITALATNVNTDLFATGSKDGQIRLWKCSEDFKKITPVLNIPVVGFVNSLAFSNNGTCLVAAIGQEHRLGRWWSIKEARNSILVIPLKIDL